MLVCVVSDLKFSCCSPSLLAAASLYVATWRRTDLDMALILRLWKLLARITGTERVSVCVMRLSVSYQDQVFVRHAPLLLVQIQPFSPGISVSFRISWQLGSSTFVALSVRAHWTVAKHMTARTSAQHPPTSKTTRVSRRLTSEKSLPDSRYRVSDVIVFQAAPVLGWLPYSHATLVTMQLR